MVWKGKMVPAYNPRPGIEKQEEEVIQIFMYRVWANLSYKRPCFKTLQTNTGTAMGNLSESLGSSQVLISEGREELMRFILLSALISECMSESALLRAQRQLRLLTICLINQQHSSNMCQENFFFFKYFWPTRTFEKESIFRLCQALKI